MRDAPTSSTFDRLSLIPLWFLPLLVVYPVLGGWLQPSLGPILFWTIYGLAWIAFIWITRKLRQTESRAREHLFTRAELCTHCAYDMQSLMPGGTRRIRREKALSTALARAAVAIDPIRCPECGNMYQPADADLKWLHRLYGKRAIDNADR